MSNHCALVFGSTHCPKCDQAKYLLKRNGIETNFVNVEEKFEEYKEKTAKELGSVPQAIPQIWMDDKYIGSYLELSQFLKEEREAA